jgi:Transcriptional regulatory protein, C terminal/Conserved hypothetical protein 698
MMTPKVTVLRWAVALLGLRVGLADIAALGLETGALIVVSMLATLVSGFIFARWYGRGPGFGALVGVGTAVCGASATLAVSTVVRFEDVDLRTYRMAVVQAARVDEGDRRQRVALDVAIEVGRVLVDGARVHLTSKEYQILELLSLRKGTTLTKEMFLNHLYGGMDEPEIKIIDVFICKLRKKLAGASNGKDYIETVWGRGYVLRELLDNEARISA